MKAHVFLYAKPPRYLQKKEPEMTGMKGWKTVGFGLLMIVVPPALTYLGGVDWTSLGISPSMSAMIGAIVIGLRAMTTTALGQKV